MLFYANNFFFLTVGLHLLCVLNWVYLLVLFNEKIKPPKTNNMVGNKQLQLMFIYTFNI